jgi:NTE family protein
VHTLVLEALDEMGCKPSVIAETSMGALIGALYASGLSGRAIKERIREHIVSRNDRGQDRVKMRVSLLKWFEVFTPELGRGGMVNAGRVLKSLSIYLCASPLRVCG